VTKVGRANLDGTAPADNPFVDGSGPNVDLIWARGFRNPFTMTFQPSTGLMWLNVVGSGWEQVFIVRRGEHGGWATYENEQPAGFITPTIAYLTNGSDIRTLATAARASNLVTFTTTTPHHMRVGEPVIIKSVTDPSFNGPLDVVSIPDATTFTAGQEGPDATSSGGTSTSQVIGGCITGGAFYDASDFPAPYRGDFFFGDYNSAQVFRATIDPDKNSVVRMRQFAATHIEYVDMALGPDGAFYQTGNRDGIVRRISYKHTAQALVVSPLHLWMAEGQGALAMVRLATMPAAAVTVTVAPAGDPDVTVSAGGTLTFTAANWNVPQPVRIAAGRDLDSAEDVATVAISSAGLESQTIAVRARDENALALATSTDMLKIDEGKNGTFTVSLSARPSLDVVVSVARASGDGDVTASPATLTFTTENWATAQTVTVSAATDGDGTDDTATLSVKAPGLVERAVTVLVADLGVPDAAAPDAAADAAPDATFAADAGAPDAPADAPIDGGVLPADTAPIVADAGGAIPATPDASLPDAPVPIDSAGGPAAVPASAGCDCRVDGGNRSGKPGAALLLVLFLLLSGRFARARASATLRTRRVPTDMKESFLLASPDLAEVSLRTAALTDCEDLRTWKNDHRQYFFFKDVISPEGQRRWFEGYQARPDDWMFMVLDGDQPVGCMGFRLRDGQADVYNVILGRPDRGGRGVMARGMALMCSFARQQLGCPVVARVLDTNPALDWYRKRGFVFETKQDGHHFIRLAEGFTPVPLLRKEIEK
jgi:RimJ/RimL family protein N-acetyltransferase